ncbi:G-protein coupled receptor 83-like [Oppia nitens]|uniref:G-protein coupled receptor 83-like n=1 Tax=Oppia nitens TaxID=1686743 RepID=UPI0023DC9D42|nr:G-protein coupled receptor 83-like [Oppia nitens]
MASNETLNSSSSTTNGVLTSDLLTYTTSDEIRDWIILSMYFLTFLLALIGNIFICLVIYNKKKLRSTTYKLIVNMAISDIIGGIVIPGQWLFCSTYLLDNGSFNHRLCGLSKSLQILSYYVSTYSMTVIAIDRYRLICRPLAPRMQPLIPILSTWILGAVFTATTFFSMRVSEYFSPIQGLIGCRVIFPSDISLLLRKWRVMLVIITQYLIPLSLTGYFYGMVIYTVWQRERVGATGGVGGVDQTKKKSFNANKKRTIKMLMTVVVMFGLAWFPTQLMHYLKFYTSVIPVQKSYNKCNSTTFYMLCYWLGISSCFYNAFIYCHFNKDFRSEAIAYWNYLVPQCLQMDLPAPGDESTSSPKPSADDTSGATNQTTSSNTNNNNNYGSTQV